MTSGASVANSVACLRIVRSIGRGPVHVDLHVAADAQPNCPKPLQERPGPGLKIQIVRGAGQEHADAPHRGLLRARRERPRCCAPPSNGMNSRRLMPGMGSLPGAPPPIITDKNH